MTDVLRAFGLYRSFRVAAIQFNSIVFRVVVGFLAQIPLEVIALVPTIEFTLNVILEVPTGYLADRWGRIPSAILGLITVILGLSSCYTGILLFPKHPDPAYFFFILQGIFIGFSSPLISGSVDAFYQDTIEATAQEDASARKSFTLSRRHGKFYPILAIFTAFGVLGFFYLTIGAHHAFALGICLYLVLIRHIYRSYKQFGDRQEDQKARPPILPSILKAKNRAILSLIYQATTFGTMASTLGYFIVSVGRFFPASSDPNLKWMIMIGFMAGGQGMAVIVEGYLLPWAINRFKEKSYVSFLFLFWIAATLAIWRLSFDLTHWVWPLLAIVYSTAMGVCCAGLRSVGQNAIAAEVPRERYAAVLSLFHMPGLIIIAIYSFYLTIQKNGAPPVNELFLAGSGLLTFGFLAHLAFYKPANSASRS